MCIPTVCLEIIMFFLFVNEGTYHMLSSYIYYQDKFVYIQTFFLMKHYTQITNNNYFFWEWSRNTK